MVYIAYGSNLNKRDMQRRCPNSQCISKGIINGYELLFRGSRDHAYATIEPKEGASVQVGVWNVTKEDEESLDFYEGYLDLYQKKQLSVGLPDGSEIKGMAYIMDDRYPLNAPSDAYTETVMKGYDDFDLPKSEFNKALNRTKRQIIASQIFM